MTTTYEKADDIPYDEDLPFAVWRIRGVKGSDRFVEGQIESRFRDLDSAASFTYSYQEGWLEIVDTTPKPRIPEDAEFIAWQTSKNAWMDVAYRDGKNLDLGKPWAWGDFLYSEEDLLTEIGDADIVVLDRREEK